MSLRDPSMDWEPTDSEVLCILERAEPNLRALAESPESFMASCPAAGGSATSAGGDGGCAAAMVLPSWAEALLEQLPDLRQNRFQLVPRRLSEEDFWSRYFAAVFAVLAEDLGDVAPKSSGGT
mmetsp:Transcript_177758/g.569955  ORF Transcript_177758/g.569955 Transcript_177758/m.569955 type:complete len:123 (-) Transcript_177758:312-680(-)